MKDISFSKYIKIFSVLIAIALIGNSNTIWVSLPSISNVFQNLLLLVLIISISVILIINAEVKINKNLTMGYLFILIYLLIYIVIKHNSFSVLLDIKSILIFSFIYFYIGICIRNQFVSLMLGYYVDILVVIGLISIFFWLFGPILGLIHPSSYVFSNWGSQSVYAVPNYFNVYFETQMLNGIPRNTAIFTEAPMASLNFFMALIIDSFFLKERKSYKQFIMIVCILTTLSSTGYIGVILFVIAKVASHNFKNPTWNMCKLILLPMILTVGLIMINTLFGKKLGDTSGQIRRDDYLAGWNALKNSPLFGQGTNSDSIKNYMSSWRSFNLGFSNTILDLLVQNGIYIFLLIIYAVVTSISNSFKNRDYDRLIFIILFIYLFVTTIFTKTFLMFFIFTLICFNWKKYIGEK